MTREYTIFDLLSDHCGHCGEPSTQLVYADDKAEELTPFYDALPICMDCYEAHDGMYWREWAHTLGKA